MAGFGRRLIAGLAAGGANYFGAKYKEQEEDRKQAALLLREQALAHTRSMLNREEKVEAGKVESQTYRDKRAADVDYENATLPGKTKAEIELAQAKERAAYERWKLQFPEEERAKLTLERFREDRADRRQDDAQQHDLDTNPVVTTENLAGETTAVFAPGARTRVVTARGSRHRAPKSTGDDFESDLRDAEAGLTPPSRTLAPPPAKAAKTEKWQDYVETAKELVGDGASKAVIERKARELAERYGG